VRRHLLPLVAASAASLAASFEAVAQTRLDPVWQAGMVVQRDTVVIVGGSSEPGALVTVTGEWGGKGEARAGADGRFVVELPTGPAGGPHQVRISADAGDAPRSIQLEDVWLGDVWIASGQSNMEMPMGHLHAGYPGVVDWESEVASASNVEVRLCTVENRVAATPAHAMAGTWQIATPESVRDFSAVGWYFARRVQAEAHVPIGIVAADWGGTPIEAWMPLEALREVGGFAAQLDELESLQRDPAARAGLEARQLEEWRLAFEAREAGAQAGWQAPLFDDGAWREVQVPAPLPLSFGEHDGTVWLRRAVEIPVHWAGSAVRLEFGAIDDCDTTWWNGEQVGETMEPGRWNAPRRYAVPPALVKAGRAVVAVRVLDTAGAGGITGHWSSCKLVKEDSGEERRLHGFWKVAIGSALADLPARPTKVEVGPWTPSALYTAMIAPLAGLRPRGAIWYQGESNRGRADQYRRLFPAMVRAWREALGTELAFYAVQIAPFAYGGDAGETGELRDAQRSILALPRTGLASTLDVGDPADIHPKRKLEVGERLARMALVDLHGVKGWSRGGPMPVECRRKLDEIAVRFAQAEGGLKAKSAMVAGFEGLCDDGKWRALEGEIAGDEILLHGASLPSGVVSVRYGFAATAVATFTNQEGWPSIAFRMAVQP
jgi:sialate O-acetylesterase